MGINAPPIASICRICALGSHLAVMVIVISSGAMNDNLNMEGKAMKAVNRSILRKTRCWRVWSLPTIDSSISELQKELSLLRAENRKLHRALADESLRHEACEELINLAESTYHIKVRKNSDAK